MGAKSTGPEGSVSAVAGSLQEFADPLAIGAPDCRMRADRRRELGEGGPLGEVLLLEPLEDRPILKHIMSRRNERVCLFRTYEE